MDGEPAQTAAMGSNGETESSDPYMRNFWYIVAAGTDLKRGKMLGVRVLDTPLLVGRLADGGVFALRDVCPHRGMPLRFGSFDGQEVTCSYHGWRFGPNGRCTAVPSMAEGQHLNVERISCGALPCRESQGTIWVWFAHDRGPTDEASLPPVPTVPDMGDMAPRVAIKVTFPCDADNATFGLLDPVHAAFVHTSAWWKKSARTLRPKQKDFELTPLGFRMKRHQLPPENRAYRLLGNPVTSEITNALPGYRMEHIKGKRHSAVSLTTITPVTTDSTTVHQCLYWTMDYLGPVIPMLRWLSRSFLNQDMTAFTRLTDGLGDARRPILVDDADTQIKWYLQAKRAYQQALAEGRPFENPVQVRALRWRS